MKRRPLLCKIHVLYRPMLIASRAGSRSYTTAFRVQGTMPWWGVRFDNSPFTIQRRAPMVRRRIGTVRKEVR